jgi:hypothetical protein
LDAAPVVDAALAWVALNAVSLTQDILENAVDNGFTSTVEDGVRHCIIDIAQTADLNSVAGCLKEVVDFRASNDWAAMDGRTVPARRLKTAIIGLRFIFKYGEYFDDAMSSAFFDIAAGRGAGDLSVWYSRPAPPSDVGAGNGTTNMGGGADGTIINDNGNAGNVLFKFTADGITEDSRVYFVPPHPGASAVAHDVLTTSDYYCLAHLYPLRDWLPSARLLTYAQQESGEPETCNQATENLKYVTGNETNFILRQFSGASWFVDAASQLHPIKDGGTYQCLAQRYYVLDGRTDSEIARFGPEGSPAVCP